MIDTITTMIPIFGVILIGRFAKQIGLITKEFLVSANRLVFYLAIPSMIFCSTCCLTFPYNVTGTVIWISIFDITLIFVMSRLICSLANLPIQLLGSVGQCSIHGNLGYIGMAVIFYYLGIEKLTHSIIMITLIMVFQNFISIISFQTQSGININNIFSINTISRLLLNPIIISAFLGIVFSIIGLELPKPLEKIFDILSNLALPTALIVIGASLSISKVNIKKWLFAISIACIFKLILMPFFAIILFRYNSVSHNDYISTLILLSSPTATVSCIMANEMGGDVEFSAIVVSLSTILSIFTFSLWLEIGNKVSF